MRTLAGWLLQGIGSVIVLFAIYLWWMSDHPDFIRSQFFVLPSIEMLGQMIVYLITCVIGAIGAMAFYYGKKLRGN